MLCLNKDQLALILQRVLCLFWKGSAAYTGRMKKEKSELSSSTLFELLNVIAELIWLLFSPKDLVLYP